MAHEPKSPTKFDIDAYLDGKVSIKASHVDLPRKPSLVFGVSILFITAVFCIGSPFLLAIPMGWTPYFAALCLLPLPAHAIAAFKGRRFPAQVPAVIISSLPYLWLAIGYFLSDGAQGGKLPL